MYALTCWAPVANGVAPQQDLRALAAGLLKARGCMDLEVGALKQGTHDYIGQLFSRKVLITTKRNGEGWDS